MSWFVVQFDYNWVTCTNHLCRKEFWRMDVLTKRKCPRCKMDNKQCLPKPKVQP